MKYNTQIVLLWFKDFGIEPVAEYKFHDTRKWRFDFAWPDSKVALEVQGGIFSGGRHTRGPALLKEMEKLNMAARTGWKVLYCIPQNLCLVDTVEMVKGAINA
jgi:hypothetical protein